jgi:uncharacterized spore protein YtfJ
MAVPHFDPATLTHAANDTFTVRRVFGEAYERDGTLVIPVARLWGGTGSGSGGGESGVPSDSTDDAVRARGPEGHGGGGGYGVHVKAVGVFVVDDSGAHWQPALDLNRVILGGQVVLGAVLSTFALAWAVKRRH